MIGTSVTACDERRPVADALIDTRTPDAAPSTPARGSDKPRTVAKMRDPAGNGAVVVSVKRWRDAFQSAPNDGSSKIFEDADVQ